MTADLSLVSLMSASHEDEPDPLEVIVVGCTRDELLAFVDGVRVRIRARRNPPRWLCDAHRDQSGRVSCEHIEALADTHPTPEQLARITGQPTERKPQ